MKKDKVESFEDLRIWQEARMLVKNVYLDYKKGSAGGTDFGFKDNTIP